MRVWEALISSAIQETRVARRRRFYSQSGFGIFIGEKPLVFLGARGKFNVLECDPRAITRVCRSSMAAETRGLELASGLNAVLCGLVG